LPNLLSFDVSDISIKIGEVAKTSDLSDLAKSSDISPITKSLKDLGGVVEGIGSLTLDEETTDKINALGTAICNMRKYFIMLHIVPQ